MATFQKNFSRPDIIELGKVSSAEKRVPSNSKRETGIRFLRKIKTQFMKQYEKVCFDGPHIPLSRVVNPLYRSPLLLTPNKQLGKKYSRSQSKAEFYRKTSIIIGLPESQPQLTRRVQQSPKMSSQS